MDTQQARALWRGHQGQQLRRAVLTASTTCWLCGHPNADTADHVIPISLRPDLALHPANLRPAHGVHGCPTCHRKCNSSRGNRLTPPRTTPGSRPW